MKMIRMSLLAASMTVAIGLVSSSAEAQENWSNFPGGKCVQALTSGTLEVDHGRAENTNTTASLRVHCPIDRQNVLNGGIATGTHVWVIDDHPTQAVSCTLEIRNMSSDAVVGVSETLSTTVGRDSSIPVKLTFAARTAGSDDVFMLSCLIPPNSGGRSSVVGVRVAESGSEVN